MDVSSGEAESWKQICVQSGEAVVEVAAFVTIGVLEVMIVMLVDAEGSCEDTMKLV